ncbi:MAG: enoyl-CoA hydratase/isomerase family protein [Acidimicrobiales bacterium]
MDFETIRLEGDGAVRHLVLDRPDVHNAIDPALVRDVHDACLAFDDDPTVRVLILRGDGPSFCSGADLKVRAPTSAARMIGSKQGARMFDVLTNLTAVTIACCHGHMIGGGAILPAGCDFRIGSPSMKVCLNENSIGANLTWHSVPAMIQLVGPVRTKEMLIFGRTYGADTMADYGYLDQVVGSDDELVPAAEAMAAEVVAQPPVPVMLTKASVNAWTKALDRAVQHMDHVAVGYTAKSENSRIAMTTYFGDRDARRYVEE